MRIEEQINIAVQPSGVWNVMRDVERWPEWTQSMSEVKRLDAGEFRVGSKARVKQPKLPAATWTVTSLEEGRGFVWENRSPGLYSVGRHFVDPSASGSKATVAIEQTGPLSGLITLVYGGLTRRYVRMEAEGLKRRSEEGSR